MNGLEDRILTLIKELEEEKRLADKRTKQLYLAGASFIGHADTPAAYAAQAGKFVKVNAVPDALAFANLVAGDLPTHSHAWADVSKTGSNLTDLATRQHAGLTNVTSDQHHPQSHTLASHSSKLHSELTGVTVNQHHARDHEATHRSGGADPLNHDNLPGFVGNEHINHGNVSMIAGSGLSGGGTIAANRTFNLGALTAAWDAGSYQIRALKFYSDQATGTAPFTVLSKTKVTNLNADLLEGYHASSVAGNNTIVLRTASGYIYCSYLNCTSGPTTGEPTHYFVETGNDSFLRQMTPANFVAKLVVYGLMPKSGGAFTGLVTARNHGTPSVDELVNVCYGTSDTPPAVGGVTEGTIYIKYTA